MINELFGLSGKKAVVTGASRGLGQALAVGLAQAGAEVICCSSQAGGCDQTLALIQKSGGKSHAEYADFSSIDAVTAMANRIIETHGTIDILVNNAGTIYREPAVDFNLFEFQKVIDVNLNSQFAISQVLGRQMVAARQGKIINTASLLSYSGGINVPAYTASKHAIAGMTKALANEWAQYNVQVNAIAPGYFVTDNTEALRNDPVRSEEILKRIPAGHWGDPKDLVGAVIYLSSAASTYVNGTLLTVDGGWMAR